ncbi:hypothetical protein J1N35_000895, partial [Gossypium stocksii]
RDKDEESIQFLKKIADMDINDFPITSEIGDKWESWNSIAPSPDLLHLDEIKEMNLVNIQEG